MNYGKTIEIFLINGGTDSILTTELLNWNGKAIKIPRIEVTKCDRDDIKRPGVYFLFCEEDDGTDSVYIGEAENVKERLTQHLRDYQSGKEKYYWKTVVIFTGSDLNKTLTRYLEHRLKVIAEKCNRYKILTKNTYQNTVVKESQKAAMEEFIDNVKLVMNILGYKILESTPTATDDTVYLYCKGAGASAKGFASSDGFTVLKDSTVSSISPSFKTRCKSYYNLRELLESDGTIVNGVFQRDYEFSAPSAASAVILGHNSSGNTDWKTENGVMLKDL